jgi:glycosyltransferase involved in cell wall biosynthesis
MARSILLIPDVPNWALDKNARDLVTYNRSDLRLDICYSEDFLNDWKRYEAEYDLLFPMYMGSFFAMLKRRVPTDKVITGVRSFHRWDGGRTRPPGYNVRPPRKIIKRLRKAVLVNTHCKKLWYVFCPYLPIIHTKYTCNLETFFPDKAARTTDRLVVGWTGSLTNHPRKRGFHEFIKPVCDDIPGIELRVQAKEDRFITDDAEMRAFYNSLDLYICASRCEGTPRPVIEASACGVPVLSTDVGIVPELIDDGENGFIVERDQRSIRIALEQILSERERLPLMGEAIRRKMEMEFNWTSLIHQWTDFFRYALELRRLRERGWLR